jgi:hypothetical protein
MLKLSRAYVLAPFHTLLGNAHSNVLMGLRIIEAIDAFPEPTLEEQQLVQFSLGSRSESLQDSRQRFKTWVLVNGFTDIHNCIRTTLERLFILKMIEKTATNLEQETIEKLERALLPKARAFSYPKLLENINSLAETKLQYQTHVASFNNAI